MRKIMLMVMLMPVLLWGQSIPFNPETKEIVYDSVYEISGTKDELYTKAKSWVAESFKSSAVPINTDDRQAGVIICNGSVEFIFQLAKGKKARKSDAIGEANFVLKILLKDNKYKVVVTDIRTNTESPTAFSSSDAGKYLIGNFYDYKTESEALRQTWKSKIEAIHEMIGYVYASITKKMSEKSDLNF
ncbi:DUF4468 domain-containing protein [Agriterribacter sp.]|uniref:DUF4468 domain-containing protein n=1 Tax=Agriterribacter sp. TaxID=2821509 RepID=UPI002BE9B02D|nr:DUF4468 domain-containing protein [Agriterribacter sp.]HRO47671.1 DUF4468 domain-containing protein [Agriterribacter sp.]HRQ17652.1 DUF4468 domain-containing protein [Agriterribacter sp.]